MKQRMRFLLFYLSYWLFQTASAQTNTVRLGLPIQIQNKLEYSLNSDSVLFNAVNFLCLYSYESFDSLIKSKPELLSLKDSSGNTLLMYAIYYKDIRYTKLLIDRGADYSKQFNSGKFCISDNCRDYYSGLLAIAAGEGKLEIVKYLIEDLHISVDLKDYDFEHKSVSGCTALHYAAYRDKHRVVDYLLNKGANINMIDGSGNTAIMLAAINNAKKSLSVLLKNNPDLNFVNDFNKKYKDYASSMREYNFDINLFNIDINVEILPSECFSNELKYKIKNLMRNIINIDSTIAKGKINLNDSIINELNLIGKDKVDCIINTYDERQKNSDSFLICPPELLTNIFFLYPLILSSRSLLTLGEKQSWFNLIPLMTDLQRLKIIDILIRENTRLDIINYKYNQKKATIKEKFLIRWYNMSYLASKEKGSFRYKYIDDFYNSYIEKTKSLNSFISNFSTSINRSSYNKDRYLYISGSDKYKIDKDELLFVRQELKKLLYTTSKYNLYFTNKLYDLIITTKQSSYALDQLIVNSDTFSSKIVEDMFKTELEFSTLIDNITKIKPLYYSTKNTSIETLCYKLNNTNSKLLDTIKLRELSNKLIIDNTTNKIIPYSDILNSYYDQQVQLDSILFNRMLRNKINTYTYRGVDDIISALGKSSVSIEFTKIKETDTSSNYYALLLTPNSDIAKIVFLCSETELKNYLGNYKIDYYYSVNNLYKLRGANSINKYENNNLYNLLWEPLEASVKGYDTIYYSTDGLLNLISISLLNKEGKFLFQSKKMFRLVSTTQLIDERNQKWIDKDSTKITVFGGIEFSDSYYATRSNGIQLSTFGKIEGTHDELNKIKLIFKDNAHLYINKEVSKYTFRKNLNTPIIHVATHGYSIPDKYLLNGTLPLDIYSCNNKIYITNFSESRTSNKDIHGVVGSQLISVFDDDNKYSIENKSVDDIYNTLNGKSGSAIYAVISNSKNIRDTLSLKRTDHNVLFRNNTINKFSTSTDPLVRNGLALYGANFSWINTTNDFSNSGILTASEISRMDMSNTKLVVLSACNTAQGDVYEDEGVYGLTRALKIAGAKYILSTYWSIPDSETVLFMEYFYRQIKEGKNPRESLDFTRNYMVSKGYPISTWGAFDITY